MKEESSLLTGDRGGGLGVPSLCPVRDGRIVRGAAYDLLALEV